VGGQRPWRWRAVDADGRTLDVLLQERRATDAAARVVRRLLGRTGAAPARITTDTLGSYAAAIAAMPAMESVEPGQGRSALRCNNRVEPAHQPTRVRERVMRRVRSTASAQRCLDACSRVANLFRPGRHLRSAVASRATMRERAAPWGEVAGLRAA
jgi:putative transposase